MPNVKGRHVQVLPRMRCIARLYLDIADVVVSQNQGYFFRGSLESTIVSINDGAYVRVPQFCEIA